MKGASILVVLFFFLSLSFADDLIYVLPSCFTGKHPLFSVSPSRKFYSFLSPEAEESNFQEQLAQIDLSLVSEKFFSFFFFLNSKDSKYYSPDKPHSCYSGS